MKKGFPLRFIAGPLLIAAALVWLVTSSMRASTLRVVPVQEVRAADGTTKSYVGQRLRVAGFIGPKGAEQAPHKTPDGVIKVARFHVTDEKGGAPMLVEYRDALPDTFRKGGPVQVDGLYGTGGVMHAEHVFTKCPSKYEDEKKAAAKKTERAAKAPDAKAPASTRNGNAAMAASY
jgi:cytochrome c-type biogenesis protein CcmE